jgi:PHD-finger
VPLTIFFQFSADIEARLHKAKVAILQAQERLEAISGQSRHRKFTEAKENELSVILRRWVLQVRSQVLVPSDVSKAELARPPFGVCLSQPMKDVVESASCLGLADLPDIPLMENYFKCMSWSLTALAFIRRKPSIEEVDYIISTSDGLRLPDERALRTLKYISNRANQIQIRCQKALSPKSGDTKSINISLLQEILKGAEELPVVVPETQILQLVIDDKGARHCYCGGPNDGLEMLRCDGCQKWFHRGCVGGDASPIEENWLCQSCGGANRDSRVEPWIPPPLLMLLIPKSCGLHSDCLVPKRPCMLLDPNVRRLQRDRTCCHRNNRNIAAHWGLNSRPRKTKFLPAPSPLTRLSCKSNEWKQGAPQRTALRRL